MCDNRPVISAEPAHHNSVESPPRSHESDIQAVGNSSSGHVCHSPQHASSPVYVSTSGASSTGDRCSVTGMAMEVDVHVSNVSPAQQSHSEAQDHPREQSDTNILLEAVTTVVSTFTTSVCEPPMPPRSAVTTGLYLVRQVIPSARMETHAALPSSRIFERGSKLAAAPRRPSTNRMYDDRWLRFANWTTGKGFYRLGPGAAQIAAFLYELFDTRGLSPQTIKGYRSCLASVLSHTDKAAAVQAKTISDMIMSM